ncbi:hypothetical protein TVAG_023830 [Trichomonas vaginalis G3]|uniref:Initiator binding domain-containing protein n=1 Tax=Trichomonas vaginalis (strain ATCC PRA-98 / G3) TaxID=412133 RepID=A2G047_TRIV3|nr:transcription-initiator DNA-binding domain ibd family [Trichomonas vaginalis G3]EAX89470.1 hypothetical protein TVAG_023830 [Trichomonas vaginalis G3]KAI5513744.1 transcription-initiator DNA-binding domain ibd family [Trichomonas vaginalis G3]|eukprot:XP_001302400.1 hypothetical protein [Trichomonas vaginalis G3]
MAEVCSPISNGRHFMGLTDGFPIPQTKVGAIQQMLGVPLISNHPNTVPVYARTQYCEINNAFEIDTGLNENGSPKNFEKISDMIIQPQAIGLIPASEWSPRPMTLKQIRDTYFTRRNGTARQFDLKLYNALCITKAEPTAAPFIGVEWIDSNHFKVDEKVFSLFLGTKCDNNALFDKQGSFSKYGFEQVYKGANPVLSRNPTCENVDDNTVRIFTDPLHRFDRDNSFNRVEL